MPSSQVSIFNIKNKEQGKFKTRELEEIEEAEGATKAEDRVG